MTGQLQFMTLQSVFICGPMSGLPGENYDAFHAAAERLRERGYDVENPAENGKPACGTWEGYLRMSIRQLTTCSVLVLLPGWQESRGASLEYSIATRLKIRCVPLETFLKEAS